jgi:hypothetical protein
MPFCDATAATLAAGRLGAPPAAVQHARSLKNARRSARGRAMASKVLLLAALLGVASAIYPDDHWSFSKKLTSANIDDEIKAAVDGGKTMFVRLIASAG